MNSKTWLTVFGLVSALVLGGAGFYAASSYGKYKTSLEGWDSKVGTIQTLERKVPYPNEKNSDAVKASLEAYQASVLKLAETLKSFQRPLNKELANTEFQQRVKKRVEEFREFARTGGLEIDSTTEFQLGFDSYANTLPQPESVPFLDYELEAIDHLLRSLVESGAELISGFERDAIPGEVGGAENHDSGVVHKYPVRFRFEGSFDTLQTFVNTLANDKEFFYILRVLKVKNEATEGALKLAADGSSNFERFENPATKELATPEMIEAWKADGASQADVEAKAKEGGFVKADQDARVLMGQEKISVFVVIDITRFLGPDEVENVETKTEPMKGGQR
jgi:hypothetical protein